MMTYSHPVSKHMSLDERKLQDLILGREKESLFRAIFFDRDGTLNIEKGYVLRPEEIALYPNTSEVLRDFKIMGFLLIVISNQSPIGRKIMSEEELEKINATLWEKLSYVEAGYDGFYYCPHPPEQKPDCECRKPRPGLMLQASIDFNIDLCESYFIGDKLSDIEAGKRAGCKTILVLTGRGIETREIIQNDASRAQPDAITSTLSDALSWIQNHENRAHLNNR